MKYIYGPVESRRLGFSLGLSLTPRKVCSFDCVYCQIGETTDKTIKRSAYVNINDILDELKNWLSNNAQQANILNYITISGSGEPTLNTGVAELILRIKEITPIPIAVITNSSLLISQSVRSELLGASLIVPSLDAVRQDIFEKVDRPQEGIRVEDIIGGLISLRKEFRGKIWLEVMLIKGINDDIRHIKKLKAVIEQINPDKIQINSPVRTTAEAGIFSVPKNKLEKIQEILGDKCEIL